jgi:hypothetical protein
MQHTQNTDEKRPQVTTSAPAIEVADATLDTKSPAQELITLLNRASELGISMDIELDAWMHAAWNAYVDARPGLREHLADMQLNAQLAALRQSGRIAQA